MPGRVRRWVAADLKSSRAVGTVATAASVYIVGSGASDRFVVHPDVIFGSPSFATAIFPLHPGAMRRACMQTAK